MIALMDRLQQLQSVRHVVIKLGTQLLSAPTEPLDIAYLARVAEQVGELRRKGIRVTIVSSGAVGAGMRLLRLPRRPKDLAQLQAVAAVGQRRLMDAWADAFEPAGLPVAQILLTREDIDNRTRFLNLRNTVHAIHAFNAVPIINENDTISTDELVKITFGDNDILAALVCQALRADLLVLMTVVDGILDAAGNPVRFISKIEDATRLLRSEKTALGKGGMSSKLEAARIVTTAGEAMIVADGRAANLLPRLLAGEELGTLFAASRDRRSGRSRWITSARVAGTIVIDDGAVEALTKKNRSLLPAGVVDVSGEFDRGDVVAVTDRGGRVVARGLSNYSSADAHRVRGKKTSELRGILGERAYDEVVHRDNLVIL